jgi:hypothetical protein
MDFALEVDWGSKTEQEFQDGSVSVASADLASPRSTALRNTLLNRVGRCPVKDCIRGLIIGARKRVEVTQPDGGLVKVWICPPCNAARPRAEMVSAGNETRRNKVMYVYVIGLDATVVCVLSVYPRSSPSCLTRPPRLPTQTQLEAAPAAAAAPHHAQNVNMIKAHLCVCVKRILVAICFLIVSCRTLADPTRGGCQLLLDTHHHGAPVLATDSATYEGRPVGPTRVG